MHFLEGLLTATVAIIVSEIVFNYGLGDFLKDKVLGLFNKAEAKVEAVKKVF